MIVAIRGIDEDAWTEVECGRTKSTVKKDEEDDNYWNCISLFINDQLNIYKP